ncbi:MAG: CPBP family intramembrane metalloprotease [Oscillospiraceae bacterium]|nr:CPBP family intramembrane metalloprotease [Oscillospiraceae bacterium]
MAEQGKLLDVVSDFSYDSENRSWNRAYRQWRRAARSRCMYRYQGNRNEVSYVDGNAVSRPNPRHVEQAALANTAEVLGLALLLHLIVTVLGSALMVGMLRLLSVNIHIDMLSLSVGGNRNAVTFVRLVTRTLKFCIPAAVVIRRCKLPRSVSAPFYFGGLPETIAAIGAAMVTAGICILISQDIGVSLAQELFTYKSRLSLIVYGVFDICVLSILSELLLRGTFLPVLRQFGDTFAIAVTGIISFLLPNTLPDRLTELLIGLASGYLLLRGGSLAKCILLRMICSALRYAGLVLVYANHAMPLWMYGLLLISIGMMAIAFFVRIRRGRIRLHNRETLLKEGKKISVMLQTVTLLPWLGLSVLLLLCQIFF